MPVAPVAYRLAAKGILREPLLYLSLYNARVQREEFKASINATETMLHRGHIVGTRGNPAAAYLYIYKVAGTRRFRDAGLVRIRQPDRTGGAALPCAHAKRRDPRLWSEFCRLAFPARVRYPCGLRGRTGRSQIANVSGGVRQLQ